jgi:catechol 2,3-dioxygenase-like lactoylglutathione lyase family enzyme
VTEPLVVQLDHVFIPVKDPAPLFDLFSRTLGLPVAWPVTDKGDFTSAAVCAGNANLEFITFTAEPSPFMPTEPLTVRGLAFEPAVPERMTSRLDELRVAHSGAVPHSDAGGSWTNVFLPEMGPLGSLVFLCAYEGDTKKERAGLREAFPSSGGGVLGVRRMAEVTIGLADLDAGMERWRRFLSPAEPDRHGAFRVGKGPTIRLKHSPIEGVAGLWLEVGSLADAREALRARDLLGPTRASGIGLDYARTGGLDVWLTEPR